jgi:hypothetical protein
VARKRLAVVCAGAGLILLLAKGYSIVSESQAKGREKANILVNAYAHHISEGSRRLDGTDDCSFGDSGLHYDPKTNQLTLRLYLSKTDLDDPDPKFVSAIHRSAAAMNDPHIGGMFDKGGGYIRLDEKKQMFFLEKAYSVEQFSVSDFLKDADNLSGLSGVWFMRWFKNVCKMAFGDEPPPDHFREWTKFSVDSASAPARIKFRAPRDC